MKTAEIITTGSELVQGDVVNTNATYLAEELTWLGLIILHHTTVPDELAAIGSAVERALERADLVVITGGIGPTRDDITRNAVATATGRKLIRDETALAQIKETFRCRQADMPSSNIRQAMMPEGSIVIPNKIGTAPGFSLKHNNREIICMPGVPIEMKWMFRDWVRPHLREEIQSTIARLHRKLHIFGIHEAAIGEKIGHMMTPESKPSVGTMVNEGTITLRMAAEAEDETSAGKALDDAETRIRRLLGDAVYGTGDDTLEDVVAVLLKKHKKTIAVAESCTGGLVGNYLTDVPGVSDCLLEDMITYTYRSKSRLTGLPESEIDKKGAVNARTAKMMAKSIREKAGADLGLSVTGAAGPTSQHPKERIGLVYCAIATRDGVKSKKFQFHGTRKWIKLMAAKSALNMVRLSLLAL